MEEAQVHKIESFWNWFQSVKDELEKNLQHDTILKQIDKRVRSFGDYSWELGPGIVNKYSFVISPNGDSEKLKETTKIIKYAPQCANWEFHASKPPKRWNLKFNINGNKNEKIEIDANNWEYVLLKFPDGTFDIIMKAPFLMSLSDNLRKTAAEILLFGVLGEERYMELIGDIEIVIDFEEKYKGNKSAIKQLSQHLETLL